MGMGTVLIACPSCSCHAFAREVRCPSCGAPLREGDGSVKRTAGAVLLGLTLVVAASTCSDGSGGGDTSTTGGGQGGMGSMMSGYQAVTTYGCGPCPTSSTTTSGGGSGQGGAPTDAGTD